ncbi:MAG: hypothetical protein B5M52_05985 [Helicobacteraceae bacterium 4484_230]|nr:MAG: hypothetical protein B5M52_05985 [Helicobacteraceae bacterium 4484_230]
MEKPEDRFTFARLCEVVGKAPFFVSNIQRALGLYVPTAGEGYSVAYVAFMEKIVALRTFNVPVADIADLFAKEKRLLELLKFDSLSSSPTWYLDGCGSPRRSDKYLLLTGYALGFHLDGHEIQSNLDFGKRDGELFAGHEMGEDISRAVAVYSKLADKVRARVEKETPVLKNALFWGSKAF